MKEKPKIKKDKIFILVLSITLANVAYNLIWLLINITNGAYRSPVHWFFLMADTLAIIGILWLIRSYRKGWRNFNQFNFKQDKTNEEKTEE